MREGGKEGESEGRREGGKEGENETRRDRAREEVHVGAERREKGKGLHSIMQQSSMQWCSWSNRSAGSRPVWCHRRETETHSLTWCERTGQSAAPTVGAKWAADQSYSYNYIHIHIHSHLKLVNCDMLKSSHGFVLSIITW